MKNRYNHYSYDNASIKRHLEQLLPSEKNNQISHCHTLTGEAYGLMGFGCMYQKGILRSILRRRRLQSVVSGDMNDITGFRCV